MPFLELKEITKRFPGVVALDRVSIAVDEGSCHALIGENGAGKSTAGKILAGIYTPDSGAIFLEGKQIDPQNPLIARKLGIAMVHQELAFCPNLSVAENLCLGDLPRNGPVLDRARMRKVAHQMLAKIETEMDVDQPIGELSTGQEQIIQIAAAIGTGARIIVMDEPTSSLSARESEHLFHLMERLKRQGVTIIYVSHRLEEIFQLCDTLTVLRDGTHVATEKTAASSPERVIHQMIGRDLISITPAHVGRDPGKEVLKVENLSSPGKFENISFEFRSGEILGIAGLVGAGRSEMAQAIFGLDPAATGKLTVHGTNLPLGNIHKALALGIGFVPEDRKRQGLVLSMNCRENASLAVLDRISLGGFIRGIKEQELISEYSNRLRLKTTSMEAPIAGLSGGNQQKIAVSKWLVRDCDILIVDEPTRGVDVGAKSEIHHLLDELAFEGMAILLISSELPELLNLSRRILVLREGRTTGMVERVNFSQATLMQLMA